MDFGVGYFPTHDGLRPGEIARRAVGPGRAGVREVEQAIGELVGR